MFGQQITQTVLPNNNKGMGILPLVAAGGAVAGAAIGVWDAMKGWPLAQTLGLVKSPTIIPNAKLPTPAAPPVDRLTDPYWSPENAGTAGLLNWKQVTTQTGIDSLLPFDDSKDNTLLLIAGVIGLLIVTR